MTELNHPLQFTKLLHHHNAYRAYSRCWARTSDILINSQAQLPTVLNGNVRPNYGVYHYNQVVFALRHSYQQLPYGADSFA